MICEECKLRPATVHMKTVIQGKVEEIYLCEECAQSRDNFNFEDSLSIHNFLAGLLDIGTRQHAQSQGDALNQCEQCNSSYSKFREIGKLGCSHCYLDFKNRLLPLIRKVQGNVRHGGKIPKRRGGKLLSRRKLNQLRQELQEAIHREAFERAAELRDQIRELETQIQEGQGGD